MKVSNEAPVNSFLRTLGELRNGDTASELNEKFSRLLAEASRKRKPGELVLRVKVKPNKDGETLELLATSKVQLPELEVLGSTFFVTEEGKLSRNDPRQKEMFAALPGGVGSDEDSGLRTELKRVVNG